MNIKFEWVFMDTDQCLALKHMQIVEETMLHKIYTTLNLI